MNLIELNSVGCVIDENGVTYTMLVDGDYDVDGACHINDIENEEFFDALSQKDIDIIEDVLGNGAYYIDPLSPESLVEGLKKLFNNDEFKKNLVNNGVKVLESTKTEIEFEKYFKKLNQVINIEQRKNFD